MEQQVNYSEHEIKAIDQSMRAAAEQNVFEAIINEELQRVGFSYPVSQNFDDENLDTLYRFVGETSEDIPLKASAAPKGVPLLSLSELQIRFNMNAVEEAIKVMRTTQHFLSVMVPCAIRLGAKNTPEYNVSERETPIELENVSFNVYNISFAPLDLRTEKNAFIVLQLRFTTKHDNVTYFCNIDLEHFLKNIL